VLEKNRVRSPLPDYLSHSERPFRESGGGDAVRAAGCPASLVSQTRSSPIAHSLPHPGNRSLLHLTLPDRRHLAALERERQALCAVDRIDGYCFGLLATMEIGRRMFPSFSTVSVDNGAHRRLLTPRLRKGIGTRQDS